MCLGAASQLAALMDAPLGPAGKPPRSLVALQAAFGVGTLVAPVYVSAWFLLPTVTPFVIAAGLVLARRVDATGPPLAAVLPAPTEPATPPRKSMFAVAATAENAAVASARVGANES